MRAVADRAGVNPALLFRYFGNEEALFAEAVTRDAPAPLTDGPPETLLERILASVFADAPGTAMLFSVLRSGDGAAQAVREELGTAYTEAFAALATTDDPVDATLRAELLPWLLGIAQVRVVLRADLDVDGTAAVAHVLRAAHTLLDGPATPG